MITSRIFAVSLLLCLFVSGQVFGMDRLARFAGRAGLFASEQGMGRRLQLFAAGGNSSTAQPQQRGFGSGTNKDEEELDTLGLSGKERAVMAAAIAAAKQVQPHTPRYHPQSAKANNPRAVHEYLEHLLASPHSSIRDQDRRKTLTVLNKELCDALAARDSEDQEECVRAINEVLDEHFAENVRR